MKTSNKVLLAIAGLLLLSAPIETKAKVKPSAIFSDGMVLQQQQNALPLWGTSSPGKQVKITASWTNQFYTTTADRDGRWKTAIATPKAGGPHTLTFNDGEISRLNDILIGEVWICSGQSNMEMPMKGFSGQPLEQGTNMDILNSTNSNLRLFTVTHNTAITPREDVKGQWQSATPSCVRDFSATAYYFGRLLQQTLNVPIGLVATHWGGSTVEAWMSREMLAEFPKVTVPQIIADVKRPQRAPTALYNGMLCPLKELSIKGMIWYQGEANITQASIYDKLFEKFIVSLRKEWNIGEFPFYFCQIAPYQYYNTNSALLREAQLNVETRVKNTGMAVLIDAGTKECIHPPKKKIAGQRLALQALVQTYGREGVACQSPVYKDMTIQNDTVILRFDRAPMGITSYYQPMKLFTLAGEDKKFYPAKAWIRNNKVFLQSENIKKPVAARYAFDNYVEGDLYSIEGLPISSFRTDRFDSDEAE